MKRDEEIAGKTCGQCFYGYRWLDGREFCAHPLDIHRNEQGGDKPIFLMQAACHDFKERINND